RLQHGVPAAAPARADGHAAADLHLHPGRALRVVQPNLVDRSSPHGRGHARLPLERSRQLALRPARRARPLAGGHARVVRGLPASAPQFRRGAVRDERAPTARPPTEAEGARGVTPGPWLRLLAIASTVGVASVVATGEWGLAHDVVANITLVLLAAVVL